MCFEGLDSISARYEHECEVLPYTIRLVDWLNTSGRNPLKIISISVCRAIRTGGPAVFPGSEDVAEVRADGAETLYSGLQHLTAICSRRTTHRAPAQEAKGAGRSTSGISYTRGEFKVLLPDSYRPGPGTAVSRPTAPPFSSVAAPAPYEVPARTIASVTIATLLPGESPRSEGLDQEHVARLAEVDAPLPPILVRRSDMRVIDGMHRLMAALVRGQTSIDVEFFEGSPADSFLLAVRANIAHGLPLSQADRRAAASRIIASHPHMSDRAIARASGLGAKAIATIRRRSSDDLPQLSVRIGRDGRARPLNNVDGRWRAAELMAENPHASLREVARLAKISPATVSDVRKRIQSGELPAAVRPHADQGTPEVTHSTKSRAGAGAVADAAVRMPAQGGRLQPNRRPRTPAPDPAVVLNKLLRDPSMRLKEEGRHLLRILQQNASAEWYQLTEAVPPHCGELVGSLARQYAATWLEFAQHLDERDRAVPQRATY